MARWLPGQADIERLLAAGELQTVVPNDELAGRLRSQAAEHMGTATSAADADPTGAYQLAYDAMRKACAATLARQGLRATRAGGHIAIRDAVRGQLDSARGGDALANFDVMRRRRQQAEYPDEKADLVSADEAGEAIAWAAAIIELVDIALPHLEGW